LGICLDNSSSRKCNNTTMIGSRTNLLGDENRPPGSLIRLVGVIMDEDLVEVGGLVLQM